MYFYSFFNHAWKFLLWRTFLAQPPNFKEQIVTEARQCHSFTLWLKPWLTGDHSPRNNGNDFHLNDNNIPKSSSGVENSWLNPRSGCGRLTNERRKWEKDDNFFFKLIARDELGKAALPEISHMNREPAPGSTLTSPKCYLATNSSLGKLRSYLATWWDEVRLATLQRNHLCLLWFEVGMETL